MDSSSPAPAQPQPNRSSPQPADLLISLLTPPLLLGIVGIRTLTDMLLQMGVASEELFRGDRLPTLTITAPPQDPQDL